MACALDPESTKKPRSNGKLSQPVRERKMMVRVLGDHAAGAAFWVTQSSLGGYENPWQTDADNTRCYVPISASAVP
jgi:hypothetical protein